MVIALRHATCLLLLCVGMNVFVCPHLYLKRVSDCIGVCLSVYLSAYIHLVLSVLFCLHLFGFVGLSAERHIILTMYIWKFIHENFRKSIDKNIRYFIILLITFNIICCSNWGLITLNLGQILFSKNISNNVHLRSIVTQCKILNNKLEISILITEQDFEKIDKMLHHNPSSNGTECVKGLYEL